MLISKFTYKKNELIQNLLIIIIFTIWTSTLESFLEFGTKTLHSIGTISTFVENNQENLWESGDMPYVFGCIHMGFSNKPLKIPNAAVAGRIVRKKSIF